MNDLIDRQAAIDALIGITMFKTKHELMQRVNASVQDEQGWLGAVAECLDEIEDLPSAQPVGHGKWIYGNDFHWYTTSCNKCGYQRRTDIKADGWNQWRYCPNCGAKMDGERKDK